MKKGKTIEKVKSLMDISFKTLCFNELKQKAAKIGWIHIFLDF